MAAGHSDAHAFWFEPQHLSQEQQAKLALLRQELQHTLLAEATLSDDLTLLRFLKARSWCVHKAAKLYEAMAAWRQEQQVQQVLHEHFEEAQQIRSLYPRFFHKVDRHGRPVEIQLVGAIDVDALLQVTSAGRFLRFHTQQAEALRMFKLPACSAAAGRTILQQTIILDMAGLSPTKHFTLTVQKILHMLSQVDQNCYPEHLGCMFMVNTPFLFRGFWSVIKTFLDERTLAKIKVLGSNFQAELLAVIPPEHLPQRYGGTSTCTEHVDVGPWTDPAVVAASPALSKAAAAGLLPGVAAAPASVHASDSCSSFIGTRVVSVVASGGAQSSDD